MNTQTNIFSFSIHSWVHFHHRFKDISFRSAIKQNENQSFSFLYVPFRFSAQKRFEKGKIAACLLHRSFLRCVDFRSALKRIVLWHAHRLVCALQNVANLFRIETELITKWPRLLRKGEECKCFRNVAASSSVLNRFPSDLQTSSMTAFVCAGSCICNFWTSSFEKIDGTGASCESSHSEQRATNISFNRGNCFSSSFPYSPQIREPNELRKRRGESRHRRGFEAKATRRTNCIFAWNDREESG